MTKINEVERALELAKKRHFGDSVPKLCGAMGFTNSYYYRAKRNGYVSLAIALKIAAILPDEVEWSSLVSEHQKDEIYSVLNYVK